MPNDRELLQQGWKLQKRNGQYFLLDPITGKEQPSDLDWQSALGVNNPNVPVKGSGVQFNIPKGIVGDVVETGLGLAQGVGNIMGADKPEPYNPNYKPPLSPLPKIDSSLQQTPWGLITPEQEEEMRKRLTSQFAKDKSLETQSTIDKSLATNPGAQKEEFYRKKNEALQEPVANIPPPPIAPPTPEDPDAAFNKRQRLMKFLSQANTSLKRVGAGMQGLAGKNVVKPDTTPGIADQELKSMENQLSPSQRVYFSKIFGTDLPENFTKDRLAALLQGKKLQNEVGDKALQQQNTKFNQDMAIKADIRAETGEARRQTEADENQKLTSEERARLRPAENAALMQKRLLLNAIDETEIIYKKKAGETGPIVGRLNKLISRWGNSAPEIAEMNAALSQLLSVYGKSMSGAAISALEFSRFKEALPSMVNPGETFDALLKRFKRQAQADYDITISSHKANKSNTSDFEQSGVDYSLWKKRKIRIPKTDLEAIEEAKRDRFEVETY